MSIAVRFSRNIAINPKMVPRMVLYISACFESGPSWSPAVQAERTAENSHAHSSSLGLWMMWYCRGQIALSENRMRSGAGGEVTRLLQAWSGGDPSALEELMTRVYAELHWIARRYMVAERPSHTLQASALILINEACQALSPQPLKNGTPPIALAMESGAS